LKEKKYYSSIGPDTDRKPFRPISRLFLGVVRLVTKRPKILLAEELPDEPVVFVGNHCRVYGPIVMLLKLKRPRRLWIRSALLYKEEMKGHLTILAEKDGKKSSAFMRAVISVAGALFRRVALAAEVIPAYQDMRIKTSFTKSAETLEEGKDVVIFAESRNASEQYKFIYEFQRGFMRFAPDYYKRTGKRVKFYPAYISSELCTISVGLPIEYDPDMNVKEWAEKVWMYTMDEVEALGQALPPHTIDQFGSKKRK